MKSDSKSLKLVTRRDVIGMVIASLGIAISVIQILEIKDTFNNCCFKFLFYNITLSVIIITITVFNFLGRRKLIKDEIHIKSLEESNKNLLEVSDNVRCFKHDFNNIMQAITGYIDVKDMNALEKYFNELMKDCNHINIMETLNVKVKDNPALYSILVSKYQKAKENNIEMNISILINLKVFTEKNYFVSRILGILLDNAIEASINSEEKIVNVTFINEFGTNTNIIEIENSYLEKNIDMKKIFDKNFTTKETSKNSGLGLWKVSEIVKNDERLILETSKTEKMFKQQLKML